MLEAVHKKLGNSKSNEKQGWNINYHTSGTFVKQTYKTAYMEGEATATFTFRIRDNTVATLVGYNVNSNVFIIK